MNITDLLVALDYRTDPVSAAAAETMRELLRHNELKDRFDEIAEKYAHRMAMYLELILLSTVKDKWFNEALDYLGKYRNEMNQIHQELAPTSFGEPLIQPESFGRIGK